MHRSTLLRLAGGMTLAAVAAGWFGVGNGGADVSAQAAPTVQTRDAGSLGTVLTGANGKTLYVFDRDTPGTSNCNDTCASTWPALTLASGQPVAPPGLSGTLALITRGDGGKQVTYNDRPLYFFASDAAAGDTKGDGVGGVWHAAKPAAATTTAAAQPAAGATQSQALPATGTGGLISRDADHSTFALALAAIGLAGLGACAIGLRASRIRGDDR